MIKTRYVDTYEIGEINKLQTEVIKVINEWVRFKKTPVPLKEITGKMLDRGINQTTTMYSLKILLKKGYIRRTVTSSTMNTSYVQLRTV